MNPPASIDANSAGTSTTRGFRLLGDNPALAQLLGLSPLLALTTSTLLGAALAAVTAAALLGAAAAMRPLAPRLRSVDRPLAALLVAAAIVALLDLLLQWQAPSLRAALGPYMPLVAGNCLLAHTLARAVAADTDTDQGMHAATASAAAFALLACLFGAARELIGAGALLHDLDLVGLDWPGLALPGGPLLRLAVMPPGAFAALAIVLLLRRRLLAGREGNADA